MQEKTNIQTSTLRVPKNILEEIKIYCRKAGKPVGEWAETAWKFIEKNDFDIYDKETTDCVTKSKFFRSIKKKHIRNFAVCVTNRIHLGK